jgi:N-methylhydantoinase A
VPTVLVPPRPGTWLALGCLMIDIRHDLSEMFRRPAEWGSGDVLPRTTEQYRDLLRRRSVSQWRG